MARRSRPAKKKAGSGGHPAAATLVIHPPPTAPQHISHSQFNYFLLNNQIEIQHPSDHKRAVQQLETEIVTKKEKATTARPYVALLGGATVLLGLVVLAFVFAGKSRPLACEPGFEAIGGACVAGQHPADRYARCIIQDVRKIDSEAASGSLSSNLKAARQEASTALDVKKSFESTVEKTVNECLLLDVSARCFVLATGGTVAPSLPPRCAK